MTFIDHCLPATICPPNPLDPSWKTSSLQHEASSASTYTVQNDSPSKQFIKKTKINMRTMLSGERAAQHVRIRVPSAPDDLCRTKFNELFFNCLMIIDAFTYLSIPVPGTCLLGTGTAARWWPLLPPEPRPRPASEARWKYCAGASKKNVKNTEASTKNI